MSRCRGGYAVTVLLNGHGILAFRDPHGVRPLCLGARPGGGGGSGLGPMGGVHSGSGGLTSAGADGGIGSGKMDLAVASESAALTGLGFSLRRDVRAGEAVFLHEETGAVSSRVCVPGSRCIADGTKAESGGTGGMGDGRTVRFKPCLFEYVYMARPDSIIDGVPASVVKGKAFDAGLCFRLFVCISVCPHL